MGTVIFETSDAGLFDTQYFLTPTDEFRGSLSTSFDTDYVGLQVEAGKSYEVRLDPNISITPYSQLLTFADGAVAYSGLTANQDEAVIRFVAETTGTYFVSPDLSGSSGSYSVTFEEIPGWRDWTIDEIADYLRVGFWSYEGQSPAKWNLDASRTITYNSTNLTENGRQLVEWAFDAWASVTDINFVSRNFGGDIIFRDDDSGAYANFSTIGTTITSASINIDRLYYDGPANLGSLAYVTFMHEIGHALGLGHGGPYNFFGTYSIDSVYANDTYRSSVMSYFDAADEAFFDASFGTQPLTPMAADIRAMWDMYGAVDVNEGNTQYGHFGPETALGNAADGVLGLYTAVNTGATTGNLSVNDIMYTVADTGGIDTINGALLDFENYIDLRDSGISNISNVASSLFLMPGTVIENAIGGALDDTLIGNGVANILSGLAGADLLIGGGGNDTLRGGDQGDRLYGDVGNDTLLGGSGIDLMFGGGGNDLLNGNAQADELDGGIGDDELNGGNGNDLIFGGDGNDILRGATDSDTLNGDAGDDELYGQQQADILNGGAGNDLLVGGNGDDELNGDDGNDLLQGFSNNDTLNGGAGADMLYGGVQIDTLNGGAGNDELYGEGGNDILSGGSGDDLLIGGFNSDTLMGDAGEDTLDGGAQADILDGGAGNDLLIGGNGNDQLNGGDDNDILRGFNNNDTLNGDAGADMLYGGAQIDILNGGAGNDELYGEGGNDTLNGGLGDDLLFGGFNSDTLRGDEGEDTLSGGAEADFLDGGADDDLLRGDGGNDTLMGGLGDDRLEGGFNNDRLDGGLGNDLLEGGAQRDTFVFMTGYGQDTVTDFQNNVDFIDLIEFGFASTADAMALASQVAGAVVFDFGGADQLILENTLLSEVDNDLLIA
jgi:serralysin